MISGQLPFGSSNVGCISVADGVTLTVNTGYTFIGTNFKMGANSKIVVNAPFRLTLQSNCKLEGCNGMWDGITLDPTNDFVASGRQLDISNSRIEDAVTGVSAQHYSKVRFVSNVFADNVIGLKVTGFVPFINFEDPNDFKHNTFTFAGINTSTGIVFDNALYFFIGQDFSIPPVIVNTVSSTYRGIDIRNSTGIGIYGITFSGMYKSGASNYSEPYYSGGLCVGIYNSREIDVKYCSMLGLPLIPAFLQPNFGIATLLGHGKQVFRNNFIRSNVLGISATSLPFPGTLLDIQNDSIIARNCIRSKWISYNTGKNILINKKRWCPKSVDLV
jgi:hypothetical protein